MGLLEFSCREARCFSAGKDGYFVSDDFSGSCLWQLLVTNGSHGSNGAGLGLWWCRSPTWLSKSHTGAHRGEFRFCVQNKLTPPPKGGGAGYHLSWVGRVGSVRSKLAHTPPTGRVCCFDGVVLLPSHLTGHKSPHRGEFGFCLLAGASQEDHPPFRQSRIRTQAEEKNTSAPLF